MRQLLLLAAALLLVPASFAQTTTNQWVYDADFIPEGADYDQTSVHGLAVDPDGKIWVQHFSPKDSVLVSQFVSDTDNGYRNTNIIYVLNPDGTEADFSPIKILEYADGTTPTDTLGGFVDDTGAWDNRSGRGMGTDKDGNILASQFQTLFKIDYKTGKGLAKSNVFGATLTAASGDDDGNIFVTTVSAQADGIVELNSDLTVASVVGTPKGFNRTILAYPDGETVLRFDYTTDYTTVFSRPDEFSPFDSTFATLYGMAIESATVHPTTGDIWVSSGSAGDPPNTAAAFVTNWRSHTWYAFAPADLLNQTVPTPRDSITWNGCTDFEDDDGNFTGVCDDAPEPTIGKPRAIAFSPDGMTAYIGNFSQLTPALQKFDLTEVVSSEPSTLADGTTLEANYPNPFAGSTTIRFELANASDVAVRVYDVMGREVATLADGAFAAGPHDVAFDASSLAAGTYLYTLEVNGQRLARRMLLAR